MPWLDIYSRDLFDINLIFFTLTKLIRGIKGNSIRTTKKNCSSYHITQYLFRLRHIHGSSLTVLFPPGKGV